MEGPGGEKYVISARLRRCSALEDAVVELTMLVWFGCAGALPHRQVCSAENLRCRFCAASTWSGAAQGGVHAARRAPVRAVCRCGVGEQGRPDLPAGAHRLLLPAAGNVRPPQPSFCLLCSAQPALAPLLVVP